MNTISCDNCKHYQSEVCPIYHHDLPFDKCPHFGGKHKPTNGDKIIAGGVRAIAEFALHHCCNNCIYFDGNNPYRSTCGKPDDKTCEDGVEAWLNAPAESEVYNETTSN